MSSDRKGDGCQSHYSGNSSGIIGHRKAVAEGDRIKYEKPAVNNRMGADIRRG
jgi:hypothetical protein